MQYLRCVRKHIVKDDLNLSKRESFFLLGILVFWKWISMMHDLEKENLFSFLEFLKYNNKKKVFSLFVFLAIGLLRPFRDELWEIQNFLKEIYL